MDRATLLAAMQAIAAEKPRAVTIPGLGDVHVRQITIDEVDAQREDTEDGASKKRIARGACRLLCDPDGNLLLDPDNADDVAKMGKLPLRVLTAINNTLELEDAATKK